MDLVAAKAIINSANGAASKGKECIKVVVRCRPLFGKEIAEKRASIVNIDMDSSVVHLVHPEDGKRKSFAFDSVYNEETLQRVFYDETGYPLVESIFEGYNGTIFAYGQTGCGKTHTMQGSNSSSELRGVIPHSFDHIFENITMNTDGSEFMVRASYLEIYNEEIRDLLGYEPKKRLELREQGDKGVFVKGLIEVVVRDVHAIQSVMEKGFKNRSVGSTHMNQESSRSHSIFTIIIETSHKIDSEDRFKTGKLNLVDLAGSERQSKTGAEGSRLKEGCKINLSLSALGNVISALVEGKGTHVPYRDSKLTRLLQDSLGGNTKTVMVAAISPADYNYDETLSTLRYANRAKNIKNKPKVNEDPKDAILREYKEEIERLRQLLEQQSSNTHFVANAQNNHLDPSLIAHSEYDYKGTHVTKIEHQLPLETAKDNQMEKAKEVAQDDVAIETANEQAIEAHARAAKMVAQAEDLMLEEEANIQSKAQEMMQKAQELMSASEAKLKTVHEVTQHSELVTSAMHSSLHAKNIPEVSDVSKDKYHDYHTKEKELLKLYNETIVNQRNHMGEQLEKQKEETEEFKKQKEELVQKLLKIQSKIIGALPMGLNGHDECSDPEHLLAKQQADFRRAQNKLKAQRKKESQLQVAQEILRNEKNAIEIELRSAQEEAEASKMGMKKRLGRYKLKLEQAREDVKDAKEEFQRDKESLLETMRDQNMEIKLLEQLTELFLSHQDLCKVREKAKWNEEDETWILPRIKPKGVYQQRKLPTLLNRPALSTPEEDEGISGGATVVSDTETYTKLPPHYPNPTFKKKEQVDGKLSSAEASKTTIKEDDNKVLRKGKPKKSNGKAVDEGVHSNRSEQCILCPLASHKTDSGDDHTKGRRFTKFDADTSITLVPIVPIRYKDQETKQMKSKVKKNQEDIDQSGSFDHSLRSTRSRRGRREESPGKSNGINISVEDIYIPPGIDP